MLSLFSYIHDYDNEGGAMSKLRSAIYGFAIGDALGVPYEFKERHTFTCTDMISHGTWNQEIGIWSDDTSLTLATAKSIKDKEYIDLKDIRKNFEAWLYHNEFTANGVVFDVGGTTRDAIELGHGMDGFHDNGNGSLMRILPLAFTDASDYDIANVSAITHAHEISKNACIEYIHIARKLIKGEKYIDDAIKNLDESEIKSGGFVLDTLKASLWCILNTDNYKDAVLKAVNLGSDTDTTAAVTGGLAGIIYGYDAIPKEWINKLKNKELIEDCLFE